MPPVTLISPEGTTIAADESQVGSLVAQGFKVATSSQETGLALDAEMEKAYGDQPLTAGAVGLARGLSLGLSDVALRGVGVSAEALRETQRQNLGASVTGEVVGALAPAILSGGSTAGASGAGILRATPAGLASRAERAITATGAGGSTLQRVGRAAAGGAVEGAAHGLGAAVSDVAMGNKPLAAETFVASGAKGALFGGAIGGGIAGAERGMASMRRLFPRSEVTREAAEVAEQEFKQATAKASATDDALQRTAKEELERIRLERAAQDLDVKRQLDEAKVRAAQAKASQQEELARVKVESAEELARIRLEKAKSGPAPRGRKKPAATETVELPPGFDAGTTPDTASILRGIPKTADDISEDALYVVSARDLSDLKPSAFDAGRQQQRIDSIRDGWEKGRTMPPLRVTVDSRGRMSIVDGRHRLQAATEDGRDIAVRFVRGVDEGTEVAEAVAQVDDKARQIVTAERALTDSKARVNEWLAKYQKKPKPGETTTRYVDSQTGGELRGIHPRATDRIVSPGIEPDFSQAISLSSRPLSRAEKAGLTAAKAEAEAMEPALRAAQRSGAIDTFRPGIPLDEGRAAVYKRLLDEAPLGARPTTSPRGYADDIDAILARADAKAAKQADDVMDDLAEGMEAIGDYERAQAKLTDALGDAAPAEAREAAQAMAAKVDEQAAKVADTVAQQADDAAAKAAGTISLGPPPAVAPSSAGQTAGRVADAMAAVEVLQMAGVPIPSAERIPYIGPVVSALLKARAFMAVVGRMGGKVPASPETKMAERVAQVRDRAAKAIDKALAIGEKTARKAPHVAIAAAVTALESPLWDDAPKRRVAKPTPASKPVDLYRKRINELEYVASNPAAVEQKVRERVPVADPGLRSAVTEAALRKLQFLLAKAPQDTRPPSLLKRTEWEPSPAALATWSRYVRAANDPVSVIEDLETGSVSPEAAETLRAVYPTMYADIQRQLLDKLPTLEAEMPYARRVQLGVLFEVPLDDSMSASSQRFLQGALKAEAAASEQQQGAQPGQPPTPSLSANVSLSQSYQTGADRRAARY